MYQYTQDRMDHCRAALEGLSEAIHESQENASKTNRMLQSMYDERSAELVRERQARMAVTKQVSSWGAAMRVVKHIAEQCDTGGPALVHPLVRAYQLIPEVHRPLAKCLHDSRTEHMSGRVDCDDCGAALATGDESEGAPPPACDHASRAKYRSGPVDLAARLVSSVEQLRDACCGVERMWPAGVESPVLYAQTECLRALAELESMDEPEEQADGK